MNGAIPPLLHVPWMQGTGQHFHCLVPSFVSKAMYCNSNPRELLAREAVPRLSLSREFPRTADGSGLARTLASLQANKPRSDETALGQSLLLLCRLPPLKLRFAVAEWSRVALTYWLVWFAASAMVYRAVATAVVYRAVATAMVYRAVVLPYANTCWRA